MSAAALLALRLLAPAQGQIFGALPQLPAGETVRVDDVVAALREIADAQRDDPDVQADWAALVERHGLRDDDDARREYARVRLLFESTRDGGLWNLHWDITNQAPNSDAIWAQWRTPMRWARCANRALSSSHSAVAEATRRLAVAGVEPRRRGVDRAG